MGRYGWLGITFEGLRIGSSVVGGCRGLDGRLDLRLEELQEGLGIQVFGLHGRVFA